METDWRKVRKVVLDDRWRRIYKPDRSAIRKVYSLFPDCEIIGFGFDPQAGFWALLVEWQAWGGNAFDCMQSVFLSKYNKSAAREGV